MRSPWAVVGCRRLVVSAAVMGMAKAVAGLVPPALFNSGSNADAPSSDTFQRGSAYREVKGVPGYESHHMPADSISPLPTNQGSSIAMEINDHRATASWGSSREARAYRQQQSSLIEKVDFRAAQQMDIRDVQDKFGSKYNDAIRQMLEYMNFKGY
jgi:hypothetical protein